MPTLEMISLMRTKTREIIIMIALMKIVVEVGFLLSFVTFGS